MEKIKTTQPPPPTGDPRIRVKRKLKFANKPAEYQKLKLKVFIDYCINTLGHKKRDTPHITKIFNHFITKDNVLDHINTHSKDIYHGIFNNCLDKYAKPSKEPKS